MDIIYILGLFLPFLNEFFNTLLISGYSKIYSVISYRLIIDTLALVGINIYLLLLFVNYGISVSFIMSFIIILTSFLIPSLFFHNIKKYIKNDKKILLILIICIILLILITHIIEKFTIKNFKDLILDKDLIKKEEIKIYHEKNKLITKN